MVAPKLVSCRVSVYRLRAYPGAGDGVGVLVSKVCEAGVKLG